MNSNLLTKKEIFKVLNELNLKSNDNILIHSSLKSIGRIEGDAEGLIDALKFNAPVAIFSSEFYEK